MKRLKFASLALAQVAMGSDRGRIDRRFIITFNKSVTYSASVERVQLNKNPVRYANEMQYRIVKRAYVCSSSLG
jgi:hypothetical protein